MAKEGFDAGVVVTVTGTRHALDNAMFLQEGRILPASKLTSLVRVQDQPFSRMTIQYGRMHTVNDILGCHGRKHFVPDDASVKQIHDAHHRIQSGGNAKKRDVCRPFFVWLVRMEVLAQQVFLFGVSCPPVLSDDIQLGLQIVLPKDALQSLMIDDDALFSKSLVYATEPYVPPLAS